MNDFIDIKDETKASENGAATGRHKPGPEPKENPRSEKVSCRLTKEEREARLRYCKAHGLTEAKLLRASYLASLTQTPNHRLERFLDDMMKPLDSIGLHPSQMQTIRSRTKDILRRSTMLLLLLLLCGAAAPTIAKTALFVYERGMSLIYGKDMACVYYFNSTEPGCEIVPDHAPAAPSGENALTPKL
jgi:hypothetical protein